MTQVTDSAGLPATGLQIGRTYTGIITFFAEALAPDVFAVIDNTIFGEPSSVKNQEARVYVTFRATKTTHNFTLNPSNQSGGGYVWVRNFSVLEGVQTGQGIDPDYDTVSITLSGLMVQILPDGQQPEQGGFISGQGNAGCEFEKLPNITPYNKPLDRVGMSATLIETGPWL